MEFNYSDTFDEAAQIARLALPLTSQHKLPANPINYAVFYQYYAGTNPSLIEATDKLLNSDKPIKQHHLIELYQSYVSTNDEKALRSIRNALHNILRTTLESLTQSDSHSSLFQMQLKEISHELSKDISATELKIIVDNIANVTKQIATKNRNTQESLYRANSEIGKLRKEFRRAQELALIDPLTNINNRRAFQAHLEKQIKLISDELPLSMLMIDIDHFKNVNDELGHQMGDDVLISVAKSLQDTIRGQDTAFRFGGEEFSVLLPETTIDGGIQVANNIRKKVSQLVLKKKSTNKQIGNITVSIGVAENNGKLSAEEFIAVADKNLYQAKKQGRNCVCG